MYKRNFPAHSIMNPTVDIHENKLGETFVQYIEQALTKIAHGENHTYKQ